MAGKITAGLVESNGSLGRLTYMLADLRLPRILLLLLFICQPLSEVAEWNSTKTGHMLGSECDLRMHV